MSYPGGRYRRLSTTVTEIEFDKFVRMADRLDATKSDLLRLLVLIAVGASELQPAIREAMRETLGRAPK